MPFVSDPRKYCYNNFLIFWWKQKSTLANFMVRNIFYPLRIMEKWISFASHYSLPHCLAKDRWAKKSFTSIFLLFQNIISSYSGRIVVQRQATKRVAVVQIAREIEFSYDGMKSETRFASPLGRTDNLFILFCFLAVIFSLLLLLAMLLFTPFFFFYTGARIYLVVKDTSRLANCKGRVKQNLHNRTEMSEFPGVYSILRNGSENVIEFTNNSPGLLRVV